MGDRSGKESKDIKDKDTQKEGKDKDQKEGKDKDSQEGTANDAAFTMFGDIPIDGDGVGALGLSNHGDPPKHHFITPDERPEVQGTSARS